MGLETIIHAVPALLDACEADVLNTLSSTNSTLRQKVLACVRKISHIEKPYERGSLQSKYIAALVSAPFVHLMDLHLSSSLSISQIALLANGDWPSLNKLKLYTPLHTTASIQQITAASWPQLEELDFGLTVLTASDIKFLVKKEWPLKVLRCQLSRYMSAEDSRDAMSSLQQSNWNSLQSIQLDFDDCPSGIEAAGLSELKRGNWPQLTTLALENWMLDKEAASHLIQGSWPHLQSLTIHVDSTDAIPMLTQAEWPQLAHLQLGQYLARTPDVVPAGLAMLKHSSWPMLKSLRLTGLEVTSDILHALSQANWTLLDMFVSEFTDWDAAIISSLTKVNWPALKKLSLRSRMTHQWPHQRHTVSIDAQSIEILSSANWPLMESIYLDTVPGDLASLMPILNAPWPCLKAFKFRSGGLDPISSEVFTKAVQDKWIGCFVEEGNPQF